jgi:DNA modification methylase
MDAVVECLKTGKHPFNGRFSGKITSGLVNTLLRKLRRQETTPIIDAATIPDEIRDKVLLCDIKDAPTRVPENTVDMILTDPPYGKEYVPLWGDLGRFATHALKDGGLLVAYCGHANLLDCCNQLSQSLKYLWISALIHSGTLADVYGLRFIAGWKPIVIFCKGHYEAHDEWFKDVIEGTGREKGSHDWQQAVGELTYFLNYFTKPQDFVVDPFCGSGTTLVACKNMNRRYLGFDIDSDCVNTAIGRLTRYG